MGYLKSASRVHSFGTIFGIMLRRFLAKKLPYSILLCMIVCSTIAANVGLSILFAAPNCDRNATDAASLATQFSAASTGETICLATGNYGTWTGGSKSVTIAAADGATPTIALSFNNGDTGITLDGLTITTGSFVNNVSNITVRNSTFTGIFLFDNIYNSNILFENNTHNNIEFIDGNPAGRVSFPYGDGATHSGVTIRNSLFRGGSSDGIQTGVGVNIFNNEFDNIQENGHPTAHTDTIQLIGASGSIVRGNYIHDGATGIVAYDGVSNVLIEHNVITTDTRPEGIELYTDTNSIIQHNTVLGSIYLDHKPADPVGTGTVIRDNIATSIVEVNGSSAAERTHNLLASGAGAGEIIGTPVYIGGSHPTSYAGYKLAAGSPGKDAASDSEDIGIVVSDPPGPDTTAPEIELTNPQDGATVQAGVTLTATATDDIGIAGVTFKYGTTTIGAEDISYPYSLNWNTHNVSNGVYTLTAIARDSSNNTTTSEAVVVTVNNNSASLARSLWNNSTIPSTIDSGDSGSVEVGLKFRSAVSGYIKGVRFYKAPTNTGTHTGRLWSLDGSELASVTFSDESASGWQEALFSTPYLINADTTYMISYHTTSGRYSVNSFFFSSSSFENYPLTAVQDNMEDGRNGLYHYGAGGVMPDLNFNAGNYWVDVVFEVPDTIPPSVNISAPSNNAYVRGTVNLNAIANDNVEVIGVQFKRGCPGSCINIGTEDTSSPYSIPWDTTQVADGQYAVTATSRDAAGNSTTATNITVNVDNTPPETSITGHPVDPSNNASPSFTFVANESASFECKLDGGSFSSCTNPKIYAGLTSGNYTFEVRAVDLAGNVDLTPAVYEWEIDITSPSVSISAPTNGTVVKGNSVTVSANGSDNYQLAGIQFKLNGVNIDAEDTVAPYSIQWDSTTASNGVHNITAVARDVIGNTATSTAILVTVNNNTRQTGNDTSSETQTPIKEQDSTQATTKDTTAPILSNINVTKIELNSATISWTTSEPTLADVIYHKAGTDKKTVIEQGIATQHSVELNGLDSATTYYFVIKSKDASSNETSSEEFDFTTLKEPIADTGTIHAENGNNEKPSETQSASWINPIVATIGGIVGIGACVAVARILITRSRAG